MDALVDVWRTYQNLVYTVGINGILALSIYVTLAAGQLSLAQAAFMGVGAYTATLCTLRLHWPFALAILAGALLPALIAVPLGLPVLRLSGVFLAIATIGFGEIVRVAVLNMEPLTGGALGIKAIPPKTHLWHIVLILALAGYALWRLQRSRAGYALEAIRQDETAARGLGIDVARWKLVVFVAGALLAGTAGGLAAHYSFFIAPNEYGFQQAVSILLYAVAGGAAVFWGPIAGSTLLTVLPEFLRGVGVQAGAVRQFVDGAVLVAVILFAPNGITGLVHGRRRTVMQADAGSGAAPGEPQTREGVAVGHAP